MNYHKQMKPVLKRIRKVIAARTEIIRKESGLNQAQFSRAIGRHTCFYGVIIHRKAPLPEDCLVFIADNFNVSLDWLFGRTDKR